MARHTLLLAICAGIAQGFETIARASKPGERVVSNDTELQIAVGDLTVSLVSFATDRIQLSRTLVLTPHARCDPRRACDGAPLHPAGRRTRLQPEAVLPQVLRQAPERAAPRAAAPVGQRRCMTPGLSESESELGET